MTLANTNLCKKEKIAREFLTWDFGEETEEGEEGQDMRAKLQELLTMAEEYFLVD